MTGHVIARPNRILAPLIFVILTALSLATDAQETIDEGVLVVRRGPETLAREEFLIQAISTGYQISSTVSYPPRRTRVVITTVLNLNSALQPTAFESAIRGGDRVLAQFGPRRIVFRRESARGESAREYPAAPRMLVVSDSVFALGALAGRLEQGAIRLLWPRADRQGDFDLTVEELGRVVVGGRQVEARRVVLSAESERREYWFDSSGRLIRIRIPSDGIEIDRSWDGTTDR